MDITEILRFVGALAFIIGLIALCAFGAKRLGLATGGLTRAGGTKRLAITEIKVVDAKHRLILIRRDNKEHLVLLGGEQDLLIETGIDAPPILEVVATDAPVVAFPTPGQHVKKILDFIRERRA